MSRLEQIVNDSRRE